MRGERRGLELWRVSCTRLLFPSSSSSVRMALSAVSHASVSWLVYCWELNVLFTVTQSHLTRGPSLSLSHDNQYAIIASWCVCVCVNLCHFAPSKTGQTHVHEKTFKFSVGICDGNGYILVISTLRFEEISECSPPFPALVFKTNRTIDIEHLSFSGFKMFREPFSA